jgi:predicted transport protein
VSEKSEKDKKTFQSYLDNIKARTGLTPEDFRKLARQKGLANAREITAWLKEDCGLGYGHAGAIYYMIAHTDDATASAADKIEKLFAGKKAAWRKTYDALETKVRKFGADVEVSPNMTYINLCRGARKFAIVQAAVERLDIGIKLKGVKPAGRFEAAGSWNAMVTHRVRITDPKQIDKELLGWLKQAYDAAA